MNHTQNKKELSTRSFTPNEILHLEFKKKEARQSYLPLLIFGSSILVFFIYGYYMSFIGKEPIIAWILSGGIGLVTVFVVALFRIGKMRPEEPQDIILQHFSKE